MIRIEWGQPPFTAAASVWPMFAEGGRRVVGCKLRLEPAEMNGTAMPPEIARQLAAALLMYTDLADRAAGR